MRACGALAGAQRARVAPRRPRGHDGRMFTAVKLLVHQWGLLTASVLVPLLQGGSDQDLLLEYLGTVEYRGLLPAKNHFRI